MRTKLLFSCFAVALCCHASAQTIKVLGNNNEPVISAHIMTTPLKTKGDLHFMTDINGVAVLSGVYPCVMSIAALGYTRQTDTLYAPADKTIYLSAQVMNEVVVTGQYAPNGTDNAVKKVQVIDRAKIDAMGAQNLRDVLTNQLNVRLSMDPILGSSMS